LDRRFTVLAAAMLAYRPRDKDASPQPEKIRPAAMMISAGLADPRMQIEIEVTARTRAQT
jgi:hypothetical protein